MCVIGQLQSIAHYTHHHTRVNMYTLQWCEEQAKYNFSRSNNHIVVDWKLKQVYLVGYFVFILASRSLVIARPESGWGEPSRLRKEFQQTSWSMCWRKLGELQASQILGGSFITSPLDLTVWWIVPLELKCYGMLSSRVRRWRWVATTG